MWLHSCRCVDNWFVDSMCQFGWCEGCSRPRLESTWSLSRLQVIKERWTTKDQRLGRLHRARPRLGQTCCDEGIWRLRVQIDQNNRRYNPISKNYGFRIEWTRDQSHVLQCLNRRLYRVGVGWSLRQILIARVYRVCNEALLEARWHYWARPLVSSEQIG